MSGSVCWEKSRQNGQRRSANSLSVTLAFGLPSVVPCCGMPASIWVISVLPLTAPPAEAPGLFVLLPPPELTAMQSFPKKLAGRRASPPRRTARPRSAGADPCAPPGRDEGGGTSAQAGSAVDRRPRGGRGLFVSREPPRAAVDLEPHPAPARPG